MKIIKNFRGYPHYVLLELTSRCNLRCVMCAINEDPRLQKGGEWYGDLSGSAFDRMKSSFPFIRRFALNGHGETLLHHQFGKYLHGIKANGGEVELTTNLTLLTDDVANAMVMNKMDVLILSIHAATPPLYAEIMPRADLNKMLSNLTLLNDYKAELSSNLPYVIFQFVAMQKNIHELPLLIELAAKMKVKRVSVLSLSEYAMVKGESLTNYPELINKWFPLACKVAFDNDIELNLPEAYTALMKKDDEEASVVADITDDNEKKGKPSCNTSNRKIRDCLDLWTFSFVLQNGNIRPCCVSDRDMGNILENDFSDIWFGDKYMKLREMFLSENPPDECKTCVSKGLTEHKTLLKRLESLVLSHSRRLQETRS